MSTPRAPPGLCTVGATDSFANATATSILATGAVRIRTDVERKRLHGLEAAATSGSNVGAGLYTVAATRQMYRQVCTLGRMVVQAGYHAVADGAFLQRWQREMFRETAASLGVPFAIVDVSAPEATLRERIGRRRQHRTDASEATLEVLDAQLRADEPLDTEERGFVVSCEAT